MDQMKRGIRAPHFHHLSYSGTSSRYLGDIKGGLSSEQRLMLAVLLDAVNILNGHQPTSSWKNRQVLAETAHWISIKGTHHPFSFDSVCDALNLPTEMLRERLRKLSSGRRETGRTGIGHLRVQQTNQARSYAMNSRPEALYEARIE
jgi:hypothetical protein